MGYVNMHVLSRLYFMETAYIRASAVSCVGKQAEQPAAGRRYE